MSLTTNSLSFPAEDVNFRVYYFMIPTIVAHKLAHGLRKIVRHATVTRVVIVATAWRAAILAALTGRAAVLAALTGRAAILAAHWQRASRPLR